MSVKLIFLGDFCASDGVMPKMGHALSSLVRSADIVSINLEAPVAQCTDSVLPKVGPAIAQPSAVLEALQAWGVNLFVLANNHIMDYGVEGLGNTLKAVGETPVLGAGMDFESAYRPHFVTINDTRIALVAFSEAQFGVLLDQSSTKEAGYSWIDHPAARACVVAARSNADIVIVQAHAGLEMVEIPLPEWRDRYKEFINLGADLVVGHHPHVIQGSEEYKGRMIYYSLGNFYMDIMARRTEPGTGGIVVVDIVDKKLTSALLPLKLAPDTVDLEPSGEAMRSYQSLCRQLANDELYVAEIDRICLEAWIKVYSAYYETALNGLGTKPKFKRLIAVVKRYLKNLARLDEGWPFKNELLLTHNIRIESHRWVVDRALRNFSKTKSRDK